MFLKNVMSDVCLHACQHTITFFSINKQDITYAYTVSNKQFYWLLCLLTGWHSQNTGVGQSNWNTGLYSVGGFMAMFASVANLHWLITHSTIKSRVWRLSYQSNITAVHKILQCIQNNVSHFTVQKTIHLVLKGSTNNPNEIIITINQKLQLSCTSYQESTVVWTVENPILVIWYIQQ